MGRGDKTDRDYIEQIIREILAGERDTPIKMREPVPVGVSNRHVHLTREHLDILFGKGYQLQKLKDLSQPGQFAAKECVTLIGQKSTIQNVRILGPERRQSQVELLMSDTFSLGLRAVVRESGNLAGSEGIYIAGPKGFVFLKEGAIVAKRHIHMTPEEAAKRGLKDQDLVKVRVGKDRAVVLEETVVRVSQDFRTELHIDIDEANSCEARNGMMAEILI